MRRTWIITAVWALGCGGGSGATEPQAATETSGVEQPAVAEAPAAPVEPVTQTEAPTVPSATPAAPSAAKAASAPFKCTPNPQAEVKRAESEDEASEVADPERPLLFDVGSMIVEFPACTKDAATEVITVSIEHENRPTSSHIEPTFTRHGHTLNVDQVITAPEGKTISVGMHASREFTKPGQKFVLAVELAGDCEGAAKRDQLDSGECSHWKLYDAEYSKERKAMLAQVPATGGYRLQFGWMPAK